MIGSTRTTNEENYLLQKFARVVLGTNNIDHHRTADLGGICGGGPWQIEFDGQHARCRERACDSADRK